MRVLILVASLLSIFYTASAFDVECGPGDVMIPNPEDCNSFFTCDNGVPRITFCPPSLHFNPVLNVCDQPGNVNCVVSTSTTTGKPTSTTTSTTVKPTTSTSTTTTPNTVEPTTVSSTTSSTTTPRPSNSTCPTEGSSVLPNPESCTSFVVCVNGHSTVVDCPPGLEFNVNTSNCDLDENVNCTVGQNNSTTQPPATNDCPEEGTIILPNPESCESFLVCVNGESTTVDCPEGLQFDPEEKQCDLDENVICEGEISITTEIVKTTTENLGSTPPFEPKCPDTGYVVLENPNDCGSFYVCVNGLYAIVDCPTGLEFNVETSKCDAPESAHCGVNGITTESTPDLYVPPCPEEGVIQLPNPYDCGSFYVCIDHLYTKLSCPEDLEFSLREQQCVEASKSNCTETAFNFYVRPRQFKCGEDGTYANPDDCGSYYACVGGNPILMDCPAGLHFDPITLICNTPEIAECEVSGTNSTIKPTATPSSTTTTTPAPTTERPNDNNKCPPNGTTFLPNPSNCNSFIVCIDGESGIVECPDGYGFNPSTSSCDSNYQCTACPNSGTAKLPNPENCASYIFCVNGESAIIHCPNGLLYNAATENCDDTVECSIPSQPTNKPISSSSSTSTSTPTSTSSSTTSKTSTSKPPAIDCEFDGLRPNPEDCSKFFICSGGVPVPMECPPGLEFSPDVLQCDSPANANCSQTSNKSLFRKFWLKWSNM